MKKRYIKNITGTEKFPLPQEMAFKEDGKIIPIKAGEMIETKLDKKSIGSETRLVIVEEEVEKKPKKTKESE
jgi:hypothetical protein